MTINRKLPVPKIALLIGLSFLPNHFNSNLSAASQSGSAPLTLLRPSIIDGSFSPDLSQLEPYSLVSVLQPDGKILVAGPTVGYAGFTMTRLNDDGSADPSFKGTDALNSPTSTNLISELARLAQKPDGKILMAENLRTSASNQVQRTRIVRLESNGSLDAGFASELAKSLQNEPVLATLDVWPDGRVFVAGDFSLVNGATQLGAALLNLDGTVDRRFDAAMFTGPNGQASVADVMLQTDAKMLVGGSFTLAAGGPRPYLARLNSDGSLDSTFNASAASISGLNSIGLIRLQPDGKILAVATLTN